MSPERMSRAATQARSWTLASSRTTMGPLRRQAARLAMKLTAIAVSLVSLSGLLVGPSLAVQPQSDRPEQADGSTQAAPKAKGAPFMWRVEGNGTTGYLYGTIHLPDERVLALAPSVEKAFAESEMFYAEIDATAASEARVQMAALLAPEERLDALVGAETWSRIEKRFEGAGLAVMTEGMKRMKPWALSAMIPMLDYVPQLAAGKAPLDKMLYERAKAAGKTVGGLETVDEQIAVFEVFSRADQIQMLKESLDVLERYDAEERSVMEETISAWLSGDQKTLMTLLDDGFGTDPRLRSAAEDELLWKRNVRLADRIADRMAANPTKTGFFAVGALHMPDEPKKAQAPDGVAAETETPPEPKLGIVTLLRAKGFRVERASAKEPATTGR